MTTARLGGVLDSLVRRPVRALNYLFVGYLRLTPIASSAVGRNQLKLSITKTLVGARGAQYKSGWSELWRHRWILSRRVGQVALSYWLDNRRGSDRATSAIRVWDRTTAADGLGIHRDADTSQSGTGIRLRLVAEVLGCVNVTVHPISHYRSKG